MKQYIGIDLGTTNSAICSYDGTSLRVWKSPEQNDVTPSVLSYDRRGNKYVGKRAYDAAPQNPKNTAQLFKRMMGTKTPIHIDVLGRDLTPEECSAEVLKTLYGYLPEEVRSDPSIGTVITVPAAFNQMQKAATREAAQMAGIGRVALMQEPVAAVMSVMRVKKQDGLFLIYDFGGGTLDVAVAERIGAQVQLIAHGGIAMCGGRDFDRGIFSSVVRPWLAEQFHLPQDFMSDVRYRSLHRLALLAVEKAKIELSGAEETHISLTEYETRTTDLDGSEIYLDIPLTRAQVDAVMEEKLAESVARVREILAQNNLSAVDFEDVVFIGGPTNYKPLRDYVSFALGIPAGVPVNPMTAVAEGAAIYAESIDWSTQELTHRPVRGEVRMAEDAVSFNYIARTAEPQAKLAVKVQGDVPDGSEFEVTGTAWTSGRCALRHGTIVTLRLDTDGANAFRITVYDRCGAVIRQEDIVIERTAAVISAIPASHSIGVEVLKTIGQSASTLDWLVRVGDRLPKKGQRVFKAAQVLRADSAESLNFKLWEGEIEEPVQDNRFIGVFSIRGTDLTDGVIPAGADLVCDYEMRDDGNISIEISVPQIGVLFRSAREVYSRQEGSVDYSAEDSVDALLAEADDVLERIEQLEGMVTDEKLGRARTRAEAAADIAYSEHPDAEPLQEAAEHLYEAKRLLYEVRRDNSANVRRAELDRLRGIYEDGVRQFASAEEKHSIETLLRRAQNAVVRRDTSFDGYMNELRGRCYGILFTQDFFVIDCFKNLLRTDPPATDPARYQTLAAEGMNAVAAGDINALRKILIEMYGLTGGGGSAGRADDFVNILRS